MSGGEAVVCVCVWVRLQPSGGVTEEKGSERRTGGLAPFLGASGT